MSIKNLLFLILFFVLPQATSAMEPQFEGSETVLIEDKSIIDHYCPPDIWRHIASYLPGDNMFLNTDVARNIELYEPEIHKIISTFLASLKNKSKAKYLAAFENFYKTTNCNHRLRTYVLEILDYAKNILNDEKYFQQDAYKNLKIKPELKNHLKELIIIKKNEYAEFSSLEKFWISLGCLLTICSMSPSAMCIALYSILSFEILAGSVYVTFAYILMIPIALLSCLKIDLEFISNLLMKLPLIFQESAQMTRTFINETANNHKETIILGFMFSIAILIMLKSYKDERCFKENKFDQIIKDLMN